MEKNLKVEFHHKLNEIIHRKNVYFASNALQRTLLTLQKSYYFVNNKKGNKMYNEETLSRTFLKAQPEELPQKNHAEVPHVENEKHLPVSHVFP